MIAEKSLIKPHPVHTVQVANLKLAQLFFEAECTSAALQAYETYATEHGHRDPVTVVTLWGQCQSLARRLLQKIKEAGLCRSPVQYVSPPDMSDTAEGLILLSQATMELVAGLPDSVSWEPGGATFRFDSMLVDRINIAVKKLRVGALRELRSTSEGPASFSSGRADRKADEKSKKLPRLPRNPDVYRLAAKINEAEGSGRKKIDIAREFADRNEKKTQSLLRKLRAFPHLLEGAERNPTGGQVV
jgi:hypothetical protein